MAIKNKLLIYYPVGARGDFLASVLFACEPRRFNYARMHAPLLESEYFKLHKIDENPKSKIFKGSALDIRRNRSIRIKLNTVEDLLTVTHLRITKVDTFIVNLPTLTELANHEQVGRFNDYHFKHIVNFHDLFDIEFLKDFYYTYNQTSMPDNLVQPIINNIKLQQQITMDNYQEYLPSVTPIIIDSVKSILNA